MAVSFLIKGFWYSRKISKPCLNGSYSSIYTLPRLRGVARILHKGVLTLVMFAVGSMIVASTLLTKKLKGYSSPRVPPRYATVDWHGAKHIRSIPGGGRTSYRNYITIT